MTALIYATCLSTGDAADFADAEQGIGASINEVAAAIEQALALIIGPALSAVVLTAYVGHKRIDIISGHKSEASAAYCDIIDSIVSGFSRNVVAAGSTDSGQVAAKSEPLVVTTGKKSNSRSS